MRTVEDTICEIEKNNATIGNLLKENQNLARELRERTDEDWDWVSVATASKFWNITQAMIYQRINRGQLNCRKFGNKTYVSMKDIKAIND